MTRPPSQAVIAAVERAEREHRWFEWCGDHPVCQTCWLTHPEAEGVCDR